MHVIPAPILLKNCQNFAFLSQKDSPVHMLAPGSSSGAVTVPRCEAPACGTLHCTLSPKFTYMYFHLKNLYKCLNLLRNRKLPHAFFFSLYWKNIKVSYFSYILIRQ